MITIELEPNDPPPPTKRNNNKYSQGQCEGKFNDSKTQTVRFLEKITKNFNFLVFLWKKIAKFPKICPFPKNFTFPKKHTYFPTFSHV